MTLFIIVLRKGVDRFLVQRYLLILRFITHEPWRSIYVGYVKLVESAQRFLIADAYLVKPKWFRNK